MADPILWTDRNYAQRLPRPASRWDANGKRVPVLTDDGDRAQERVPQTGRVGLVRSVDEIRNTTPMADARSVQVLRDDGHETNMVLRTAAAATHGEHGSDNSFARYNLAKARKHGWIVGEACPVDLVLRRERRAQQMRSAVVQAAIEKREPCGPRAKGEPPCSHYLAEREARQARRLREHLDQNARNKSSVDRQTEALVSFVEKMAPPAAPSSPAELEFAPRKGGGK